MNFLIHFFLFLCLSLFAGCGEKSAPEAVPKGAPPATGAAGRRGCAGCHDAVLDKAHDFACTACHQGSAAAASRDAAHAGLVSRPAHPDFMEEVCGRCHRELVAGARQGLHFTHAREVGAVRRAFGAVSDIAGVKAVPRRDGPPGTKLELADDLLRRQCLGCHVATAGEPFDATRRGSGCAACHLVFQDGRLRSHVFQPRPDDRRCLACHYGNRVGADYHGLFEQDLNREFRTPFAEIGPVRPYGVETHRLAADVHQEKGMLCIDCHGSSSVHRVAGEKAAVSGVTCASCHRPPGAAPIWPGIAAKDGLHLLQGKADGKSRIVPALAHPAHRQYGGRVDCQVCHAQWSFQDQGSHLLRHDAPDPDEWWRLSIQGSAALEQLLDGGKVEPDAGMIDWQSGGKGPGWWLRAFGQRRWEEVQLGRDSSGMLRVVRPSLDLHLSYVNGAGRVVMDGVRAAAGARLRPYTPHTTGRAGLFYLQRLENAGLLSSVDKGRK